MHFGKKKTTQMQALEMRAFYHGMAPPKKIVDGPWAFCHA
jgi:hypothetical protein